MALVESDLEDLCAADPDSNCDPISEPRKGSHARTDQQIAAGNYHRRQHLLTAVQNGGAGRLALVALGW